MISARELENARHGPVEKIVRHGRDSNSYRCRDGFLRHQDSGADRSLQISFRVGVFGKQNEVNDVAVDFRSGEASSEGVLNGNRFDQRQRWQFELLAHAGSPKITGELSLVNQSNYKTDSLALFLRSFASEVAGRSFLIARNLLAFFRFLPSIHETAHRYLHFIQLTHCGALIVSDLDRQGAVRVSARRSDQSRTRKRIENHFHRHAGSSFSFPKWERLSCRSLAVTASV